MNDFWIKLRRNVWNLGKDDPRRVIHAIKAGLAMSVVSLFYLADPLFSGIGDNVIWAIMTVVVVFEFTAGATLFKGLSRGVGTLLGGSLSVSIDYLAEKAGPSGQAISIVVSILMLGTAATYSRFFPKVKSKYDYGVVIFILTFNFITVSGYRVNNLFQMAWERVSTIAIGCGICLILSLFVSPIWAGEDVHNSLVAKHQGLAESIEACLEEYFKASPECTAQNADESHKSLEDTIYRGYRAVLDSKTSIEESMVNFASWEPPHGNFGFRHPWKQYCKVGSMLRNLAYTVGALHGCLHSEIEASRYSRLVFREQCTKVGEKVAEILKELGNSIKCMHQCRASVSMMEELNASVQELNMAFHLQPRLLFHIISKNPTEDHWIPPLNSPQNFTQGIQHDLAQSNESQISKENNEQISELFPVEDHELNRKAESSYLLAAIGHQSCKNTHSAEFAETLPIATFASLLIDMVNRLEYVIEAVEELGKLAAFKTKC
ncbi:hypothetical protein SUGI_0806560 [Cryptomeria japonica]|nr:hypothetical protein SUGI_0806560 [Cryptomeria japonica]